MKSIIIKCVVLIALLTMVFSCTEDEVKADDNMVSIKFQCRQTGAVDPNIVSFALPGIVNVTCYETIPNLDWGRPHHVWAITLIMAEGTDVTKLAPVIKLAPGATITPDSGTVRDFTRWVEWAYTLTAPDGSTVYYLVKAYTLVDDKVSIKIQCDRTGAVDPNIISLALPNLVDARCYEHLPEPNYGGFPNAWSPHYWTITLVMADGTDCTKLAPIITLVPGATITNIESISGDVQDFSQQIDYTVIAPNGSTVTYKFGAFAYR